MIAEIPSAFKRKTPSAFHLLSDEDKQVAKRMEPMAACCGLDAQTLYLSALMSKDPGLYFQRGGVNRQAEEFLEIFKNLP